MKVVTSIIFIHEGTTAQAAVLDHSGEGRGLRFELGAGWASGYHHSKTLALLSMAHNVLYMDLPTRDPLKTSPFQVIIIGTTHHQELLHLYYMAMPSSQFRVTFISERGVKPQGKHAKIISLQSMQVGLYNYFLIHGSIGIIPLKCLIAVLKILPQYYHTHPSLAL
jgi:hypothetical protein